MYSIMIMSVYIEASCSSSAAVKLFRPLTLGLTRYSLLSVLSNISNSVSIDLSPITSNLNLQLELSHYDFYYLHAFDSAKSVLNITYKIYLFETYQSCVHGPI